MRNVIERAALVALLALVACGPKTMEVRMQHGEKLAGDADSTLDEAEGQMRALEPDRAEKLIADAEDTLKDPDVEFYPERGMLRDRIKKDREQLPAVRAEKAARELALAVKKQREALVAPSTALKAAEPKVHEPNVTRDDVKALRSAAKDTASTLSDGKELEAKDASYGAEAKALAAEVAHAEALVALAEKLVDFREGPGASQLSAQQSLAKLKSEKAPDKRASLLHDAFDAFSKCADKGHAAVLETPELEHQKLTLGEQVNTPGAVVKQCSAELKPLQKKVAAADKAAKAAKASAASASKKTKSKVKR